jgi:hypothetical protein
MNSKNGDYRFSALVRLNTVSALVPLNRPALVPLNMSALVPLNMSALVQHPEERAQEERGVKINYLLHF